MKPDLIIYDHTKTKLTFNGDVIIADPHFIFSNRVSADLNNLQFAKVAFDRSDTDDSWKGGVVTMDHHQWLICNAANNAGFYNIDGLNDYITVDSGMIAVMSYDILKEDYCVYEDYLFKDIVVFTEVSGEVSINPEKGEIIGPHFKLITSDEEEDQNPQAVSFGVGKVDVRTG